MSAKGPRPAYEERAVPLGGGRIPASMSGPEVSDAPAPNIVLSAEYKALERQRNSLGELKKLIAAINIPVANIAKLSGEYHHHHPASSSSSSSAGHSTSLITALAGGSLESQTSSAPTAQAQTDSTSASVDGKSESAKPSAKGSAALEKEKAKRSEIISQLKSIRESFLSSSSHIELIDKVIKDAENAEKLNENEMLNWSEWARKAGQGLFREQTKLLEQMKIEKKKCAEETPAAAAESADK